MLRRFSISFAVFSMGLDYLLVGLSLLAMTALRPMLSTLPFIRDIPSTTWLPVPFYFLFPLLWVVAYSAASLYDGKKYLRVTDELAGLTISSLIITICLAGILFLSFRDVSRALFVSFSLLSTLLCILWRMATRLFFRIRKDYLNINKRILVIGAPKIAQNLLKKFRPGHQDGVQSVRVAFPFDKEAPLHAQEQEIRQTLLEEEITDLVIAVPASGMHKINDLLGALDDLPLNIWIGLDVLDLSFANTKVEDFYGIPMLDLRALALSEFDQMIKRIFDLLFTTSLMVLLLPLMALIAILVAVFDGFPIFFNQERVGINGKLFKVHKFRTMVNKAEEILPQPGENGEALPHKLRNDPRVTRLGRFLRRFSLDELPQFFNVLEGNMSVVGPRPELPRLVQGYERWQRKRLTVLPGITGWWQVNGRSDKMLHLHSEDDIYYVQNYSIWLDLQIIVRTIWVVLIGKGAF